MSLKENWDQRSSDYLTWGEGVSFNLIKRNLVYANILRLMLARKIKELQPCSLLEVGCGPGRLFSLYQGISSVVCVDLSPKMVMRARQTAKEKGLSNIMVQEMDAGCLCFEKVFDMIITSNLLLHIPHVMIEKVISSICRYSSDVVCVEWVEPGGVDCGDCYLHDYEELFMGHGYVLVDKRVVPFEKQLLMHFRRVEI